MISYILGRMRSRPEAVVLRLSPAGGLHARRRSSRPEAVHVNAHVHARHQHVHAHVCTICKAPRAGQSSQSRQQQCPCIYICNRACRARACARACRMRCMYLRMCMYMHAHVCGHAHVHVCGLAHVHVHVCERMCMCVYAYAAASASASAASASASAASNRRGECRE
jgi:hypothetical protein